MMKIDSVSVCEGLRVLEFENIFEYDHKSLNLYLETRIPKNAYPVPSKHPSPLPIHSLYYFRHLKSPMQPMKRYFLW